MLNKFEVGHIYSDGYVDSHRALVIGRTEDEVDVLIFKNSIEHGCVYGRLPLQKQESSYASDCFYEIFFYQLPEENVRPYGIRRSDFNTIPSSISALSVYRDDIYGMDCREAMKNALKIFEEKADYFAESARKVEKLLSNFKKN